MNQAVLYALPVDPECGSDPRYLGRSFRRKIARLLEQPHTGADLPFLSRARERARIVDALAVGSGARLNEAILSTGDVRTGTGVQITDLYCAGSLRIGSGSALRVAASDGAMNLADRCSVARWIDAEGDLWIGDDCIVGHSASAGGCLGVGSGVEFRRLFGNPIVVGDARDAAVPEPPPAHTCDCIAPHDVEVGEGEVLPGSIESGGEVRIRAGAYVAGDIVAGGSVHVERGAIVYGHVFSEHDIVLEGGAIAGCAHGAKTLYAAGDVTLGTGATVYGAVVAGGRGVTR